MAQVPLNYGSAAEDGTGDPLFTMFAKIAANLTDLDTRLASTTALVGALGGAAALNVGTTVGTVADGGALTAETNRAQAAEGANALAIQANTAAIAAEASRAQGVEATKAPLASPVFTGAPTVPTATTGTATTQAASTAFVANAVAASGGGPVVPPSRQIQTSGLATGGGDLSTDRTITVPKATQSDVATGTNDTKALTPYSVAAALGALAPLASPALVGTPTAPTAAAGTNTTQIGTTGFTTAALAALIANTLGGDANFAATVAAALGNRLRGDAAGGYTDAVKGQFRANLLGAPASVSASGTFSAADVGRKIRASGTITRTLPAISGLFAGWATGEIENTGAGIVTVTAGAGDAFEGIAAGSLALLPKQRAYFYLDADGWHVGWVERSPIIATMAVGASVASWDIALPVGYKTFRIVGNGFAPGTAGAQIVFRLSDDGGATIKTGASDYVSNVIYSDGGTGPSAAPLSAAQGQITGSLAVGPANTAQFELRLDPGGGGVRPTWTSKANFVDNGSGGLSSRSYGGTLIAISTNRASLIRLLWSSGTGVGGYTVVADP